MPDKAKQAHIERRSAETRGANKVGIYIEPGHKPSPGPAYMLERRKLPALIMLKKEDR